MNFRVLRLNDAPQNPEQMRGQGKLLHSDVQRLQLLIRDERLVPFPLTGSRMGLVPALEVVAEPGDLILPTGIPAVVAVFNTCKPTAATCTYLLKLFQLHRETGQ